MDIEKIKDKAGVLISIIFVCVFLLIPWYMWAKENNEKNELLKDYKEVKKEIKDINKLIDTIDELIEKNEELIKSKNKYVSLYCTSVKFSTNECKNFITETQKAIVKTETEKQKIMGKYHFDISKDDE